MTETFSNLTGHWMGRYEYSAAGSPVAFEVRIEDSGGGISGEMSEPNSFRPGQGTVLNAVINGARSGQSVGFTKLYQGMPGSSVLIYEGTADAKFRRIEGRWRFDDPRLGNGRFSMVRMTPAAARAERRTTADVEA